MVQPFWKTVWQFLKNLNIELLYESAIPHLVYIPSLEPCSLCPPTPDPSPLVHRRGLSWVPCTIQLLPVISCSGCSTLCYPVDCSPSGFSGHGISQIKILERAAISSSRASSRPRDQAHISCISCTGRWILYHWATWEAPSYQSDQVKSNIFLLAQAWH